jgi:hypothetical protein
MPLAASLAKASSSFLFICICLSLTLNRVIYDKQLHKICYSLQISSNRLKMPPVFLLYHQCDDIQFKFF